MSRAEDLVSLVQFCDSHGIEISLLHRLHDSGLVEVIRDGDTLFVRVETVPRLEKIVRLHIDLDINLEGIEAISHLLDRIELLQLENVALRNRLRLFE
jgi:chaperone modulatory protein CbpM